MNRREENRALRDFDLLGRIYDELGPLIRPVLARATHDSGQRHHVKDEDLAPWLRGTGEHPDPTGDAAIADEIRDSVAADIEGMVKHLGYALNIAKKVLTITPVDVAERAAREIPDCAACGDPINGKIFYGRWDNKCRVRFQRWVAAGNAADEKLRFEITIRAEKDVQSDVSAGQD